VGCSFQASSRPNTVGSPDPCIVERKDIGGIGCDSAAKPLAEQRLLTAPMLELSQNINSSANISACRSGVAWGIMGATDHTNPKTRMLAASGKGWWRSCGEKCPHTSRHSSFEDNKTERTHPPTRMLAASMLKALLADRARKRKVLVRRVEDTSTTPT